jgi:hypothetical protein
MDILKARKSSDDVLELRSKPSGWSLEERHISKNYLRHSSVVLVPAERSRRVMPPVTAVVIPDFVVFSTNQRQPANM